MRFKQVVTSLVYPHQPLLALQSMTIMHLAVVNVFIDDASASYLTVTRSRERAQLTPAGTWSASNNQCSQCSAMQLAYVPHHQVLHSCVAMFYRSLAPSESTGLFTRLQM